MLSIPAVSTEYVRVAVQAESAGEPADISTASVEMAFVPGSAAPAGDWSPASWDVDATTTPTTYRAQCLVGPDGAVELARGSYTVWLRIVDSPETVVRPAGALRIT